MCVDFFLDFAKARTPKSECLSKVEIAIKGRDEKERNRKTWGKILILITFRLIGRHENQPLNMGVQTHKYREKVKIADSYSMFQGYCNVLQRTTKS